MERRNTHGALAAALSGLLTAACGGGDEGSPGKYRVGPGEDHREISAVAARLLPGDVVEVKGDAAYQGGFTFSQAGTREQPITIRGIPGPSGARPVVLGGEHTITFEGDHYLFESLEVTGGGFSCVLQRSDDLTLRDVAVHDCPGHGILGADKDSGSLTLEYVEVYAAGEGEGKHPIYVATDEGWYPGSVFRMEHSYVHDGRGGNNVKSRAERNEIRYNWIEGAMFLELELIGPDGQDRSLAREDSDVVGNVFVQTGGSGVIGIGGDGTGDTDGRYRFVGNTFVLSQAAGGLFRIKDGIQSLEVHNSVVFREGGGGVRVLFADEAAWEAGSPVIAGSGNWLPEGSTEVPGEWTGTTLGIEPGFVDVATLDVVPRADSPLVDGASAAPEGPPGYAFPDPLAAPAFLPRAAAQKPGTAAQRPVAGALDIGAFEYAPGGG